ncbi:MAG: hypothetical protein Q4C96_00210 [Planctomycetia bacterium]|nr:hypothetical protein [Planctomycetia bacterium]
MRYQFINEHSISQIRVIVHNGIRTTNPSDELLDSLGIGYPYSPSNSHDSENKHVEKDHSYSLVDGIIYDVWTLTPTN